MLKHTKKLAITAALAGSLFATATSAFAHDCVVSNKPTGAGSVATINFDTGEMTANKPNPGTEEKPHGAFITLTSATQQITVDTFVHAPEKARAPGAEPGVIPGATKQESQGRGADFKGLDTIDARLGGG
jgi:hypothetical protein